MEKINLKDVYDHFSKLLADEDRKASILYAIDLLTKGHITIPNLYEMILAPLLNLHDYKNDATRIAREHVRSGIIRSIIEISYPFVLSERAKPQFVDLHKKVLITCPTEEYHEIGARMAVDFFELAGFDAVFTGGNTPGPDIIAAIGYQKPDYVALSVSNLYNLVKAKDIIKEIQVVYPQIPVLIGGAVFNDPAHRQVVLNTRHINDYNAVLALAKEVKNALL